MSPAEYQEATQALQHGAEWVRGGGGHYFWRAHPAMATPPAAGETWYLHTGPGLLPADLLKQMTTPDGAPATQSPDSAQLLNSTRIGEFALDFYESQQTGLVREG